MGKWNAAILSFAVTIVVGGAIVLAISHTSAGISCGRGFVSLSVRRGSVCVERTLSLTDRVQIVRAADAALPAVELEFVRTFQRIPQIRIYAVVSSFGSALGATGQTEETREQLGGSASAVMDAESYRILVNWQRIGPGSLDGVLRHELTHAMLRDLGIRVGALPIWFDEGLAMLAQGGSPILTGTQAAHLLETSVPLAGLATLDGWARLSPTESYGVATAAVAALRERLGVEGIRQLATTVAQGSTLDAAYLHLTGASMDAFARSLPAALRAGRRP